MSRAPSVTGVLPNALQMGRQFRLEAASMGRSSEGGGGETLRQARLQAFRVAFRTCLAFHACTIQAMRQIHKMVTTKCHVPDVPSGPRVHPSSLQRAGLRSATLLAMLLRVLLLAGMGRQIRSSILAAGSMEACVDDGDELQCAQRFVTTLSVENAQNRTESITAYRLRDFAQADGTKVELEDSLSITLAKSSIVLRYPLRYERTYNADPRELILVRDSQGRDYNWLTNPCKDGTGPDAACGSYVDPTTGVTIPYSQGFCCRCEFGDYIAGGPAGLSRANLQCSLLSTEMAQSAHCLRWGPLWYRAFSLGPPVVHFVIEAQVTYCPGGTSCSSRTHYLSPSSTGLCVVLPGLASDKDHPCDIQLSLEGDLAAYEGAKSFASSLLMRPHSCDDFAACGTQVTEAPGRWLIVPQSFTTQGSGCDKIGVSHEAFAGQPQRCGMNINACLNQQLSDLYAADVEAEASGRQPSYFVSAHGYGGRFAVDDTDLSNTVALFETARLQRSIVSVQLSAERLRYTVLVARAVISRATVAPFEAKSGGGQLTVSVRSVGNVQAQFTLAVTCSASLLAPVPSRAMTLLPGQTSDAAFPLEAVSSSAASGTCTVVVSDSLFRQCDNATVTVTVTSLEEDRGSQGGDLDEDAPTESHGAGPAALADKPCGQRCQWADVLCALLAWCWPRLVEYAAVAAACSIGLAALVKHPGLFFCAPCRASSQAPPPPAFAVQNPAWGSKPRREKREKRARRR